MKYYWSINLLICCKIISFHQLLLMSMIFPFWFTKFLIYLLIALVANVLPLILPFSQYQWPLRYFTPNNEIFVPTDFNSTTIRSVKKCRKNAWRNYCHRSFWNVKLDSVQIWTFFSLFVNTYMYTLKKRKKISLSKKECLSLRENHLKKKNVTVINSSKCFYNKFYRFDEGPFFCIGTR